MEDDSLIEKQLCIIGYSGHAFVVIETLRAQGFEVNAYCDSHEKSFNPYGLTYLGSEKNSTVINYLTEQNFFFFIGIGNNSMRQRVYENMRSISLKSVVAKHASAIISSTASVGKATFVSAAAVLQANASIGEAVICNSGCIIEHGCRIDDFVHIGPGAVLCGDVSVGKGSLIGAGAVVNPGITIGKNAIVGSGAVVIKNVSDNSVVAGNPAREIKVTI